MERRKTEDLTQVLFRFLREQGLETPLNEYRLLESWDEVVGPLATKYTLEKKIINQKLYIKLSSSALRAELQMRRAHLVVELNQKVGANIITDIYFQ
jgi:predicted nucleic acid-binding Zn ribbon protein